MRESGKEKKNPLRFRAGPTEEGSTFTRRPPPELGFSSLYTFKISGGGSVLKGKKRGGKGRRVLVVKRESKKGKKKSSPLWHWPESWGKDYQCCLLVKKAEGSRRGAGRSHLALRTTGKKKRGFFMRLLKKNRISPRQKISWKGEEERDMKGFAKHKERGKRRFRIFYLQAKKKKSP